MEVSFGEGWLSLIFDLEFFLLERKKVNFDVRLECFLFLPRFKTVLHICLMIAISSPSYEKSLLDLFITKLIKFNHITNFLFNSFNPTGANPLNLFIKILSFI